MKKNAPLIGFLSAFGVMLLAFIIYFLFLAKKNEYLVDNPTSKTFYFKINNGEKKLLLLGSM
jgi:apolipoprotein N-acyltransferase